MLKKELWELRKTEQKCQQKQLLKDKQKRDRQIADALKQADLNMEKLKKQELDAHSLYALDSTSKDTQRTLLPLTCHHKALNQHV